MKFRPLHDRVVVRRVDAEEKTKGGIIIPDTAKEKPQEGEVIAAGPGARDESGTLVPLDVKAGDRVISAIQQSREQEARSWLPKTYASQPTLATACSAASKLSPMP